MADASDSKSDGGNSVGVQVPSPAPETPGFSKASSLCRDLFVISLGNALEREVANVPYHDIPWRL